MTRKQTRFGLFFPLFTLAAMSWTWCGGIAGAMEKQDPSVRLEGFSSRARNPDMLPVSISFANVEKAADRQGDGIPEWASLEWGKIMLGELERTLSFQTEGTQENINDILAFRDWCTRASGGGNLSLAISAEEIAVDLLFRELARKNGARGEVADLFRRCHTNGMTADYWLKTLAVEGIEVENGTANDDKVPNYLRLRGVFAWIKEKCAGPFAHSFFPTTNWSRSECLAEFMPYALMWRTMTLEDKKVALEICLAIQEGLGDIPEGRDEFRVSAQNCADDILREEERLSSWTTAVDVWNYWADALDMVRPGPEPRRSKR